MTTARERLNVAIVEAVSVGRRPACGEPWARELFTSDSAQDRAYAARACTGCPVISECATAADEAGELFVWGGLDRGAQPSGRRSA